MNKVEEMRKMAEGKDKVYERLVAEGIYTREELEQVRAKHRAMLDQTVPFGNGARLKPLNRTPNHAVGECYKPHDLNTHDPHEQYAWADENLPWWAWAFRLLGGVVFLASIGLLIFAGLLL